MSTDRAPPRYRAYLLRFWQERGGSATGTALWRFSLEDPQTGARHGYATLEQMMAVLTRETADTPEVVRAGERSFATTQATVGQEAHMPQDVHVEDEAAIRGLIEQVQAGWNANDGAAFAAPFAENADYVVVNGNYVNGRQEIAHGHQQIFDTIYRGSHNTATVRSIRFLRDDVAVAHVTWRLQVPQGPAAGEHQAINTMVLTKNDGAWRIAAFHNTPIVDQATARRP